MESRQRVARHRGNFPEAPHGSTSSPSSARPTPLPTLLWLVASLAGCGPAVAPVDPDGGLRTCGGCLVGQVFDDGSERCVTACATTTDADGDGSMAIECGGDDCADGDSTVHPGARERCDDLDTDCNDSVDYPGEDVDGDGFSSCAEGGGPRDCDDQDASVFPGAMEACVGPERLDEGLLGGTRLQRPRWPVSRPTT